MSAAQPIDDHTILAVLAELSGARACLDAAEAAAHALSRPAISVLHVRVDPMRDILPTEEILSDEEQRAMELDAEREGKLLGDIYSAWGAVLPRGIHSEWCDIVGDVEEEVRVRGSNAALNVMANLTAKSRGHARTAFHAALFETHRPLLVVPHAYEPRAVRRIVIGWKDTDVSRKAIQAAAPWLKRAEHVIVVRVGAEDALEMESATQALAEHHVSCELKTVSVQQGQSVGEQLLTEARSLKADWIVAGAYRHGEFIEWVLGGVTKSLLQHASLPIFMTH